MNAMQGFRPQGAEAPSRALLLAALLVWSASLGGCQAINDFGRFTFGDAGPAGDDDDDDMAGDDDDDATGPSAVVQTSGGDTVLENAEYRLRISVGAPQPAGVARDGSNELRLGPQSRP